MIVVKSMINGTLESFKEYFMQKEIEIVVKYKSVRE